MRKVISGNELKKVMLDAINVLGECVGSTLGPSGNNCLIDMDEASPFITNDGVTIAKSIESEDKLVNSVLQIAKEASLKTNELVGDGTTSTIVLLESIFKSGLKEVSLGMKGVILKRELNDAVLEALSYLEELKRVPKENDLISIAKTSTNDLELGVFLAEVFMKMKSKYAIKIMESDTEKTYYEIKKGYSVDVDSIPKLYFEKSKEIVLDNAYILLLRGNLSYLEQISDIINEGLEREKNVVIFASECDEIVKNEVLSYYLRNKKNIFLFNVPDYGSRKEDILNDLAFITNSSIKNVDYESVLFSDLGKVKEVVINEYEATIINDYQNDCYIKELKDKLNNNYNDYEIEFLSSRLAKLDRGIATIYVGAKTKTENKEKLMRVIDGINALDMSFRGIVVGEGIAPLIVSSKMKDDTIGKKIIKESLEKPFMKIMENAGCDGSLRKKEIEESGYKKIFNFDTNSYDLVSNTLILDPLEVVKEEIKNAVSIASMLLTTKYLVINEKVNDEISNDNYL